MIQTKNAFLAFVFLLQVGSLFAQVPVIAPEIPVNHTLNEHSLIPCPHNRFVAVKDGDKIRLYTGTGLLLYNVIYTGCYISHAVFSDGGRYLFVTTRYDGTQPECEQVKVFETTTGEKVFETGSTIVFSQGCEDEILLIDEQKKISCYDLAAKKKSAPGKKISAERVTLVKQNLDRLTQDDRLVLYHAVNDFFFVCGSRGDYQLLMSPRGKTWFAAKGITEVPEYRGKRSPNTRLMVLETNNGKFLFDEKNTALFELPEGKIEKITDERWLFYSENRLYAAGSGQWQTCTPFNLQKNTSDGLVAWSSGCLANGTFYVREMGFDPAPAGARQRPARLHPENIRMYHDFPNVLMLNGLNWNIDDPSGYFVSGPELAWQMLDGNKKIKPALVPLEAAGENDREHTIYFPLGCLLPPTAGRETSIKHSLTQTFYGTGPFFFSCNNCLPDQLDPAFQLDVLRHTADSKTADSLLAKGFVSVGEDDYFLQRAYTHRLSLPAHALQMLEKRNEKYIANIEKMFGRSRFMQLNAGFPLHYFRNGQPMKTVVLSGKYTADNQSLNDALFAPAYEGGKTGEGGSELRNAISVTALAHPSTDVFGYNVYLLRHEEAPLEPGRFGPVTLAYHEEINLPLTDGKSLAVNWGRGYFRLRDKNQAIMVTGFIAGEKEFMLMTPDHYYYSTRSFTHAITFRMGEKAYSYDQFDLKYNRPDIVLKRLGCKDSLAISSYHRAYLKRLKRMKFTEEQLRDDFHLPEVEIQNPNDLPADTDSPGLHLQLRLHDTKYRLDRINVFLNDVPVYGTAGIDLRPDNAMACEKQLTIHLAEGKNKIQVSVLNEAGAESYPETVHINYQPKASVKPNLYLVTIGDSRYQDSRYDLSYAATDAEDIARAFAQSPVYGRVSSFVLTNEKVTRENILKLKEELQKAQRDDVVMIAVAGHGVLDKDFNYYLATYDMDFNDPAKRGLPYEELEALLDGIMALKKVLLIDACHSGEVDKEEVEHLAMAATGNGEIKFRAAGAGIQKKNLGLKTTGELMNELFTDLRRGTGATVISSAGGVELAMESDQWKNGLFTYCMLHGLKDKVADLDGDGQIMLSELQQYLRSEVTRLSNGAQQPTSRIENVNMDFRIW